MFSLKAILFWTMVQWLVGIGSMLLVANFWNFVDKLPVWQSFNFKKKLLSFKYENNKPKEAYIATFIMSLVAMGLGFLMFR
jgi:hypothetical protein